MPRIFPAYTPIATPKDTSVRDNPPTSGDGPVFDFDTGEFKTTPSGGVLIVTGQNALAEWIRKTLVTPRFTHGIYPDWYGSDIIGKGSRRIIGRATGQAQPADKNGNMSVVGDIERAIEEALLVDRRIIEVRDFSSRFEDDNVYTTFTVLTTLGPIEGLQVVTELR